MNKRSAVLRSLAALALGAALGGCDTGIGEGAFLENLAIVKTTGVLGASDNRVYVCFRDKLAAIGTFSDGLQGDYSNRVNWTSLHPTIVHVSNADIAIEGDRVPGDPLSVFDKGTLIPKAEGSATIVADFIGLHATFNVVSRKAKRINVTPVTQTLSPNTIVGLTATGVFDDYTVEVTGEAEWVFDNPGIDAGDSDGDGVANAQDTCADTPISDEVDATGCTVAPIAQIGRFTGLVRGATASTRTLRARAKFLTCEDILAPSGDPDNVLLEPGASSVTADLTVTVPQSLALTREAGGTTGPDLIVNTSDAFAAVVTFPDGTTQDLSRQVRLTSDPVTVAGTNATAPNVVLGIGAGSATISACFDPLPAQNDADADVDTTDSCAATDPNRLLSNSIMLNVVAGTLNSFTVSPVAPSITGLGTQQFTAEGTFTVNGAPRQHDITRHVTWSSSDNSVAIIASGTITGGKAFSLSTAAGAVDITATSAAATVDTTEKARLCIFPPETVDRPCAPPTP